MGSLIEILSVAAARVEGAEGIMLVGLDGIVIEKCRFPGDFPADQFAAELAVLLKEAKRKLTEVCAGEIKELAVVTNGNRFLLQMISPEYFLLLKLSAHSNYGRARFELRKAQIALINELAS